MKYLLIIFITGLVLSACSTQQEFMYRPVDKKEMWTIRIEQGDVSGQFEVYINDIIVFEETPSIFGSTIDEKTLFNNYEVRLIVNKSGTCLGIGGGYNASLLIDNELITKMDF